ncbi:hypothetical protein THII_3011 [Thioploca ingrica]|uniref:Uncharacterized protein n=1 Tax=Thioploca ingrica TaxID=40754 RepID=A0A090AGG9_9GAMM|nr:hypothetical protein THII_3011 [Thioploca ingrica]
MIIVLSCPRYKTCQATTWDGQANENAVVKNTDTLNLVGSSTPRRYPTLSPGHNSSRCWRQWLLESGSWWLRRNLRRQYHSSRHHLRLAMVEKAMLINLNGMVFGEVRLTMETKPGGNSLFLPTTCC